MSVHKKNILFLGKDSKLAANVQSVLKKSLPDSDLLTASSLEDFDKQVSQQAIQVCLLDSSFLENSDSSTINKIYKLAAELPFIFLLDKEKHTLGEEVLNKGAFDYLVKVDGVLSALPFTIDQALEKRPVDFKLKEKPRISEPKKQIPTGFFEINESGRFITFDEELLRLIGLDEKDLYKTYLTDLLPEDDQEKFYRWRAAVLDKKEGFHLHTQIIHPEKGILPVELHLYPYELVKHFSGFRGYLKLGSEEPVEEKESHEETYKTQNFYYEIYNLNKYLSKGLHQLFLMKVTEIPMKYFNFEQVYLFLWDAVNHRYQKEICLQNEKRVKREDLRSEFFSPEEIQFLNDSPSFVEFVHQSLLSDESRQKVYGKNGAGLFKKAEWASGQPWKKGDRLFLEIRDSNSTLLGFLILESPKNQKIPPRWVLRQLEIFAIFTSTLFEGNNRFRKAHDQHKRLKRLFRIFGTFYLDTPLMDVLQEVAWSIKFSMGFNLVMLGVLSKSTHRLELKAVAVDNREKGRVLSRLRFAAGQISRYLTNRYKLSQSYFITQKDNPFYLIKRIYGLPINTYRDAGVWYYPDVLLVPIRSKKGRIMGLLILDDPENHKRPDIESVQILEKIASTIAVAIENKVGYTQLRRENDLLHLKLNSQTAGNGNGKKLREFFKRINL